jgi:sulfatase maturation enzyme AslB (radical SAM superfamily)
MKLIFGRHDAVTRDDVVWCYRTLLGREPASEDELARHLKSRSMRALVEAFTTSTEYQQRLQDAGRPLPAAAADGPTARLVAPQDNEALAMAEYRAGVLHVNSTPRSMTLETTSRCNLRCVMCTHGINAVDRPKHLDEAIIQRLQRFLGQTYDMQLHGIGEPLISPAFWRALQYIPASSKASVNSNFSELSDRRLEQLLASNLDHVNVSLDAATPLTYARIRGFDFETVMQNLRRFMAARQQRGTRKPQLYLNMTLMRSNIEEAPAFVDLAADLGADIACMWHLNRWPESEMRRFRVERDGWFFDYSKEGLWNHAALSNRLIRAAQERAAERKLHLYFGAENKDIFFPEPAGEAVA